MSGINDSNATDAYDQALAVIKGGTDNTSVGNVGDRLKVDAHVTSMSTSTTTPSNILFENGTLARDTQPALNTWTDVYSYTGSGKFYGTIVNLEAAGAGESTKWYVNIVTDSTYKMFGTNGILCDDIINNNVYDIKDLLWLDFSTLGFHDNSFRIDLKNSPIVFTSRIQIQVKRISSLKKFKSCLVRLTKDS